MMASLGGPISNVAMNLAFIVRAPLVASSKTVRNLDAAEG